MSKTSRKLPSHVASAVDAARWFPFVWAVHVDKSALQSCRRQNHFSQSSCGPRCRANANISRDPEESKHRGRVPEVANSLAYTWIPLSVSAARLSTAAPFSLFCISSSRAQISFPVIRGCVRQQEWFCEDCYHVVWLRKRKKRLLWCANRGKFFDQRTFLNDFLFAISRIKIMERLHTNSSHFIMKTVLCLIVALEC